MSEIDTDLLNELTQLGQDTGQPLVENLLKGFKENFPLQLEKARLLCSENRHAELEHLIHSLKSSAATLGARKVHEFCQVIETRASQKISVSEHQLSNISTLIESALLEIESFLLTYRNLQSNSSNGAAKILYNGSV